MIHSFLTILCCLLFFLVGAQNTDLPGPTPNLQTLPAGSYVIPMDNSLQVNSTGDFNLKAYGLIVYLLNNNVKVKWSIKAGKAKDDIDFTASAEQIKPTLIAGGVSKNFKAGPFVIFAADTSGVASLISTFYSNNSLTGTNRPQVYRLTSDVTNVDIRYDLTAFRPKAAVLTDGGNQNIHLAYMTAAAIPAESYATSQGTDLLSNCFTFASEPHNNKTGTAVNNAISAIKDFVTKGGNFLAQCEAVANYENNTLGRFQTTGGITVPNTGTGTTVNYSNADLSFSQFEGIFNASYGGSVRNWQIVGSPTNNQHNHVTGIGANSSILGASVSKHFYDRGGLVFYLGSHSFTTSSLDGINGIRMYMNAFLTPSNTNCPELLYNPLGLKLTEFSGAMVNSKTSLKWTVSDNELVYRFLIEKSTDGNNFSVLNTVQPLAKTGPCSYRYSETERGEKIYYRIKVSDKQNRFLFSPIIALSSSSQARPYISLLNGPGSEDLQLGYFNNKNDFISLRVYNSNGSIVYSQKSKTTEGMNLLSIPFSSTNKKGLYLIEVVNSEQLVFKTKVLKQ